MTINNLQAIKVRLYPNQKQLQALNSNAGSCRFVYNYFLDLQKKRYFSKEKYLSEYELSALLTKLKQKEEYIWLKEVDSQALQQSLKHLVQSLKEHSKEMYRFNAGHRKDKPDYPKFRSKHKHNQFTTTANNKFSTSLPQESGKRKMKKVKGGKLGFIKARGTFTLNSLDFTKQKVSYSKSSSGKWYASILIKHSKDISQSHIHKYESCGIDLGVVNPITMSVTFDDNVIRHSIIGKEEQEKLRQLERRRNKYHKSFSRKQKGSKNKEKAKKKLQKAYEKEHNFVKDFNHKISNKIAKAVEIVVVEDLKIKNMTRRGKGKQGLNKEILRMSPSSFVSMLAYKCKRYNGKLVKVNPAYTSQTCSCCGYIDKENRENQSTFICKECNHSMNADVNASRVVLSRGLSSLVH